MQRMERRVSFQEAPWVVDGSTFFLDGGGLCLAHSRPFRDAGAFVPWPMGPPMNAIPLEFAGAT